MRGEKTMNLTTFGSGSRTRGLVRAMAIAVCACALSVGAALQAQTQQQNGTQSNSGKNKTNPKGPTTTGNPVTPPPATPAVDSTYVIGPADVLSLSVYKAPELTGDLVVRPDGKITVPLIGDLQAAGLTPSELHDRIVKALEDSKMYGEVTATVGVKQINSQRVSVTGCGAGKTGTYQLTPGWTVLNLIGEAGLQGWAKRKEIKVYRVVNGKPQTFPVNFEQLEEGLKLDQNIPLKSGDILIIPGDC